MGTLKGDIEQISSGKQLPEGSVMFQEPENNEIGKSFYEKNHYCFDGKEKIFKRWNKREIRYVKG